MCLGIPVKVIEVSKDGKEGKVEFGNIKRRVILELVDNIKPGDYVLLHTGIAINKLEEEEAQEILEMFKEIYKEDFNIEEANNLKE